MDLVFTFFFSTEDEEVVENDKPPSIVAEKLHRLISPAKVSPDSRKSQNNLLSTVHRRLFQAAEILV